VISLHPEDRSLQSKELSHVVESLVDTLGFSEHQYIAARHNDKDHEHLHVAINKIHPESFRLHSPSWDHQKLLVPGLASSLRYAQGDFATIFMLHRVLDGGAGAAHLNPMQLRRGLEHLRRNGYEVVSLAEVFRRLAGEGPRLHGTVAFTIDDGYLDQAEIAGPIFSEFDCPVTTFVTAGFLDGALWLWWDKIEYVFSNTRRESLALRIGETTVRCELNSESRLDVMSADFAERCKVIDDEEKHAAIAHLAQEAEVDLPDAAPSMYAPMTWDHVRTLEGQGMTFGPHSVSHPILSRIQAESAVREITESWRRVREEARSPVPIFCYPNGCDADYGDREVAVLRDLGFVGALSADGGFADPASFRESGDGPFRTKRLPFPEELSHLAQYVTGIERFSRIVRGLEI
jgi:peptidoglycan/xylan/chitin deacetylase (PgdA/CDA1 family)